MNGHFNIGAITPTKYFFSIAIILGLLFAMTSVDQEKPTALVFLQWQLQTVVPMALLIVAHMLLMGIRRFSDLNPWLALIISGVIGATLFAPVALLIDLWLETASPVSFIGELLDEWGSVVLPVTICWLALNAPWLLGYRLEKNALPEKDASEKNQNTLLPSSFQPDFMLLVPPEKRGRVILLKSELHYLQVVTEKGSALILYNLGDAVDQLPRESGILVHRSYWVALDAIDDLVKRGRQGELKLHDGQRVPVSRNRLPIVRKILIGR